MSESRSTGRPPMSARARTPLVIAGVLLGLAIVVPLLVPTYSRDEPRLWGFPFFYWYQLLWVFICAALVMIAHGRQYLIGQQLAEVDGNSGVSTRP